MITSVLNAIEAERAYQEKKWHGQPHTVLEWIQIMHHCLGNARGFNRNGNDKAAMDEIRQAVAVGIAAMEEHGAPEREVFNL